MRWHIAMREEIAYMLEVATLCRKLPKLSYVQRPCPAKPTFVNSRRLTFPSLPSRLHRPRSPSCALDRGRPAGPGTYILPRPGGIPMPSVHLLASWHSQLIPILRTHIAQFRLLPLRQMRYTLSLPIS